MLKAMFNSKVMYVCLCTGVTERDIHEALEAGAASVEEVAYCTGAGTRCGTCRATLAAMVEQSDESPRRGCLRVLTTAA
jgi:bacterioferritin-associated ferredoxin